MRSAILPAHLRVLDNCLYTVMLIARRRWHSYAFYRSCSIPVGFTLSRDAATTPTHIDYAFQYDGVNVFPNTLDIPRTRHCAGHLPPRVIGARRPMRLGRGSIVSLASATYICRPKICRCWCCVLSTTRFADLIQPDLRVLVRSGYDRTAHRTCPAIRTVSGRRLGRRWPLDWQAPCKASRSGFLGAAAAVATGATRQRSRRPCVSGWAEGQ